MSFFGELLRMSGRKLQRSDFGALDFLLPLPSGKKPSPTECRVSMFFFFFLLKSRRTKDVCEFVFQGSKVLSE